MSDQFEPQETTIDEIHQAMERGDVTSQGLVDYYLDRIEHIDQEKPNLNAIVTVNPKARDRARELDQTYENEGRVGPLHGIPVLVKDQAKTEGLTTTFGSIAFSDYIPKEDATLVKKLKEAGAIVLAKTNLPDWATHWFGYSSSAGRTKNPYALERDPGGSSAGTGSGVAANLGAIGIGEDTGGSIRVPAAYCNLYGIRVTTGLISRKGFSQLVTRQDTPGPMTRTMRDLAILLDILIGYDPEDEWTSANELTHLDGSYTNHLRDDGLEGRRIGVLREGFGDDDNPDAAPVNDVVESALESFEEAGAELIDPVSFPDLEDQINETLLYELRSKRDLNDFLSNLEDSPVDSVTEMYESGQYHELMDLFEAIAEGPEDPTDMVEYWRSVSGQESFQRSIVNVFAEHDLDGIVFPNVQVIPPTDEELREGKYDAYTFPTNTVIASQTSCPAMSLPGGFTDDGIPVGVELLGKPYDEHNLIEMAYAFENEADTRRPPKL